MVRVLFIDDDREIQKRINIALSDDFDFSSAFSGREGIEKAVDLDPDVVLLDIHLPDMDGFGVLSKLMSLPAPPPVVMLTVVADVEMIVKAIKMGAMDYIVKPFTLDYLKHRIMTAVEHAPVRIKTGMNDPVLGQLVGVSPQIEQIRDLIRCAAPYDIRILIYGESGTGKEIVAQLIHKLSARNSGPFKSVNCAAFPPTLIESELFGSTKGAFTDARDKPGIFEAADAGTLFLDEIAELSLEAQAKLLRVTETSQISRVGSTATIKVDARLIAATNKDLRKEIDRGNFRDDLLYRIEGYQIRIPPLRERKEDIPILSLHFLSQFGKENFALSTEALDKLRAHSWPGNVRELKNVMERALISGRKEIIMPEDIIFYS
ncbi:MAG: sigma-54-dependent Fis family transcriptional regulator [Spirochaetales bacterium]|nr:sigma-54-dependent Fis family transcriptional regulator [Spirochaetales bacterium]